MGKIIYDYVEFVRFPIIKRANDRRIMRWVMGFVKKKALSLEMIFCPEKRNKMKWKDNMHTKKYNTKKIRTIL